MTSWGTSGPGSVVNFEWRTYRRRPKPAIVVGMSKAGSVIAPSRQWRRGRRRPYVGRLRERTPRPVRALGATHGGGGASIPALRPGRDGHRPEPLPRAREGREEVDSVLCARESVLDGRLGSVEGGGVAEEQVVAVGFVEQGVDLEAELPGVDVLRQIALLLSREDVGLE